MAEYIEREKAIEILRDSADAYGPFSVECSIYLTAKQKVENIPAADVQEVRCKDCKYYMDMFCYAHNKIKNNLYVPPLHNTKESDFCSYGERREEDD